MAGFGLLVQQDRAVGDEREQPVALRSRTGSCSHSHSHSRSHVRACTLTSTCSGVDCGTGFRAGVFFRDLGVVNLRSGQPTLQMTGGAAARLAAITPPGMEARVALTMTDEYPYASAIVIISAVPVVGASS